MAQTYHVCSKHACPAACSTGNQEGVVAQADNACAGKTQCQEIYKTPTSPFMKRQWQCKTATYMTAIKKKKKKNIVRYSN